MTGTVPPTDAPRRAPVNALPVAARALTSRRYAAAYSHFVAFMKVMLPVVALVLLATLAAWPYLQTADKRFRIGFAALEARETGAPTMVNARYVGVDGQSRPFAVTADLAHNAAPEAKRIELEMPKADITLKDGTWLVLTAESGVYARVDDVLDLSNDVVLYHDGGYELQTEQARVDLARGITEGERSVLGHGPFGELRSQGFRMKNQGRTIHFTGKARLVLRPHRDAPLW